MDNLNIYGAVIIQLFLWNMIVFHTKKDKTGSTVDLTDHNEFYSKNDTGTNQAIYDKCYEEKGCFGTPDNCVDKRNCDMLGNLIFWQKLIFCCKKGTTPNKYFSLYKFNKLQHKLTINQIYFELQFSYRDITQEHH